MKKLGIIAVLACLSIWATPNAFAGGDWDSCEGFKGKLLNACHQVDEREDQAGVGADILIHETESVDLVAEYKYDLNNEDHSIFGVLKTKKSLVEYIKALLNRGE